MIVAWSTLEWPVSKTTMVIRVLSWAYSVLSDSTIDFCVAVIDWVCCLAHEHVRVVGKLLGNFAEPVGTWENYFTRVINSQFPPLLSCTSSPLYFSYGYCYGWPAPCSQDSRWALYPPPWKGCAWIQQPITRLPLCWRTFQSTTSQNFLMRYLNYPPNVLSFWTIYHVASRRRWSNISWSLYVAFISCLLLRAR